MGWLSCNFPTIARLIGGKGNSSSRVKQSRGRGRRGARSAEAPQPEIDVSLLESAVEPVIEADSGLDPEIASAIGVAAAEDAPTKTATEAATQALTEETTAAPVDPEVASPNTTEESRRSGTGEAQASGQSLGQRPGTIASATNIEQTYNTCVELEGTIVAAQSELRALLADRANAEAMRSQAHDAMEQADAAWQEAGLLGDVAWRAFERGFSVDTPEFVNRLRVIREVYEARKAQVQLQRVNIQRLGKKPTEPGRTPLPTY